MIANIWEQERERRASEFGERVMYECVPDVRDHYLESMNK